MKTYIILTAATLIGAPAFAGGLGQPVVEPVVAPIEAPVQTRADGDWSGAYVGAQIGYGNVTGAGTFDGNGNLGGVHAGYRMDFGQFVAGAELSYDKSKIDIGAGDTLDNVTRLKLIGGADLGRALVYGTIGASHGEATIGAATVKDNGYFGGIGVDYAVSENWTVGGEYLVNRFNDFGGAGTDLNVNTLEAKVSFKF